MLFLLLFVTFSDLLAHKNDLKEKRKIIHEKISFDSVKISPRMEIFSFENSGGGFEINSEVNSNDSVIFTYNRNKTIYVYAFQSPQNNNELKLFEVQKDTLTEVKELYNFELQNDSSGISISKLKIDDNIYVSPNLYKLIFCTENVAGVSSFISVCVSKNEF